MKFFYTLFLSLLMCTSALAATELTVSGAPTIETKTIQGKKINWYTFQISNAPSSKTNKTVVIKATGVDSNKNSDDVYVLRYGSLACAANLDYQLSVFGTNTTNATLKISGGTNGDFIDINNCKIEWTNPTYSFVYNSGNSGPEHFTIDNPTSCNVSSYNASTQRLYMYDADNTLDLYYDSESIYGEFDKDNFNDFTQFNSADANFSELEFSVKMSPALTVTGNGTFSNGDELEFSYAETELNVTEGVQVEQCKYEDGGYAIEFGNGLTQICLKKNASDGDFAGNDFDLSRCASAYVTGTDENHNFTDLTFTLEGNPASANGWAIEGYGTANGVKVSFSYSNLTYNRFAVNAIFTNKPEDMGDCNKFAMIDGEDKELEIYFESWQDPYNACSTHKGSYDDQPFQKTVITSYGTSPFIRVEGYGVLASKDTIAFVGNESFDLQGTKLTTNTHSGDGHTISFGDNVNTISIAFSGDFAAKHTEFNTASFSNGSNSYDFSDLDFTITGDADASWEIHGSGTLAYGTKITFDFVSIIVNISEAKYATYYNADQAVKIQNNVEAYVAWVDNGELHFEREYDAWKPVIPAGVAVVLYCETPGSISMFPTSEAGTAPVNPNHLVGTATAISATEMEAAHSDCLFYALSLDGDEPEDAYDSVGFFWLEENGGGFDLGAGKAYLPVATAQAARGFSFADALGISDVKAEKEAGVMYNVNGQRVRVAKGLVVREGKMMFVK